MAAVTFAAGCTGGEPSATAPLADHNLIVIVVDTLRADHVGFLGAARDTTPFLDSLAGHGVAFEQAVSNSSYTRESVSSLLTGRLPSMSGSMGWNAAPSDQLPTLGELCADAGYRTGFFTATIMLGNPRFTRGFQVVDQLVKQAGISGMSHELTDRALGFVRDSKSKPFMMYVHYLDPHGPYDPPDALKRRFTDHPEPHPVGLYSQLRPALMRYEAEGFGPGEARYEDMVLRYDAEILDVDDAIRSLFDGLRAAGVADDTLVVLTADHGEEFLEHGYIEHAWTLYQESLHVPLLFWAPGALEASRVARRVAEVDILPSIAALLGLPADAERLDGHALFDARGRPAGQDAPVVSELLVPHRNVVRAAMLGDWKYIQARRWLDPEQRTRMVQAREKVAIEQAESVPFDPWSPVVREELFDLGADPREQTDLCGSRADQLERMRALLAAFEARAKELAPSQQGTAEELSLDAETAERIRSIGY